LRAAGLSADATDHAYHALDSHITGYTLWVAQLSVDEDERRTMAETFLSRIDTDRLPHLAEHVRQHLKEPGPEQDDNGAFAFGLDLILDGLERIRSAG
jgi:hypothetical protein